VSIASLPLAALLLRHFGGRRELSRRVKIRGPIGVLQWDIHFKPRALHQVCVGLFLSEVINPREPKSFSPTAAARHRVSNGRSDAILVKKSPQDHDKDDDCYDIAH
jgi:hypothetical protein